MWKDISRSATGQNNIKLGAYYNAGADSVLGDTLFERPIPEENIDSIDVGGNQVQLHTSNSKSEKFSSLDISAELSLSLVCLPIEISGSGKYFQETKKDFHSQCMSLIYSCRTVETSINYRHLKDYIDLGGLRKIQEGEIPATHVITSITWGGKCMPQ